MAPLNIRVVAVAPGRCDTPLLRKYEELGLWEHIEREQMRGFTQPAEIANDPEDLWAWMDALRQAFFAKQIKCLVKVRPQATKFWKTPQRWKLFVEQALQSLKTILTVIQRSIALGGRIFQRQENE